LKVEPLRLHDYTAGRAVNSYQMQKSKLSAVEKFDT
jgi:hypothetical protein